MKLLVEEIKVPTPRVITLILTEEEAARLKLLANTIYRRPTVADDVRNPTMKEFGDTLWGKLDIAGIDSI